MWHIPVFGDNLQPFDSLGVSDDIIEEGRAVFLDPGSLFDQSDCPGGLLFNEVNLPGKLIVLGSSGCGTLEAISSSTS